MWNNVEVMKNLETSLSPSNTLHGFERMYRTTSSLHSKSRYLQAPLKCIRSATPQQFKNESVERAVYYSSVSPHVSHSVHDHYFLHVQETVCYWSEPIPPNKGIHQNDSKPERYVSCDLSASDD